MNEDNNYFGSRNPDARNTTLIELKQDLFLHTLNWPLVPNILRGPGSVLSPFVGNGYYIGKMNPLIGVEDKKILTS